MESSLKTPAYSPRKFSRLLKCRHWGASVCWVLKRRCELGARAQETFCLLADCLLRSVPLHGAIHFCDQCCFQCNSSVSCPKSWTCFSIRVAFYAMRSCTLGTLLSSGGFYSVSESSVSCECVSLPCEFALLIVSPCSNRYFLIEAGAK